jgi:hypothetical protein
MITVKGPSAAAVLEMLGQGPDVAKSVNVFGWVVDQRDDHIVVKWGSTRPAADSRYNRVPKRDIEHMLLMEETDETQGNTQQ